MLRWRLVAVFGIADALSATTSSEVFAVSALGGAQQGAAFRHALRRDAVVVVMPDESQKEAIAGLSTFATNFFALDSSEQLSFGPLHEPPHCDAHAGVAMPVGTWQSSYSFGRPVSTFLDTRLRRGASGLEVLPRSLEAACPGAARQLVDGQAALLRVATTALRAALDGRLSDALLGDLVDDPAALAPGASAATVQRFARYESAAADAAAAHVAFDAHTDGTFLTLVPTSDVPGLEVEAGDGWLRPERGAPPGSVVVMSGDGLRFVSGGAYPSARHRVLHPEPGASARVSAPFLLRASPRFRPARDFRLPDG